jgi:hypothetical protein
MKKLTGTLLLLSLLTSCQKKEDNNKNTGSSADTPCGDHHSNQLYKDTSGNCYYLNADGSKEYVEKHECNC